MTASGLACLKWALQHFYFRPIILEKQYGVAVSIPATLSLQYRGL
jgi:hypothetical protein